MKNKVMLGVVGLLMIVSLLFIACAAPTLSPTPSPKPSPTVAPSPTIVPTLSPTPVVTWPKVIAFSSRQPEAKATRMAIAVASLLEKNAPVTTKVSNQATDARVYYPLQTGDVQMIVDTSLSTWGVWFGLEPFPGRFTNLRVLCSVAAFDAEAAARGDSGIKGVEDVKGMRWASVRGIPAYLAQEEAILKGKGLTWNDVNVIPVAAPVEGVRAVLENRADIVGTMGTGMAIFDQAVQQVGAYVIPTDWKDPRVVAAFAAVPPAEPLLLTKDIWLGVPKDTWGISTPAVVMVNKNMDNELAYAITKLLYDKLDEYGKGDPWIEAMVKVQGGRAAFLPKGTMVMPYHEGAIRFMKEKKLWTDTNQKAQEMLFRDPPEVLPIKYQLPG